MPLGGREFRIGRQTEWIASISALDPRAPSRLARSNRRTALARTRLLRSTLLLGLAAAFAAITSAQAESVEQFYKGRTINFLVASVPGGSNDLMARLVALPAQLGPVLMYAIEALMPPKNMRTPRRVAPAASLHKFVPKFFGPAKSIPVRPRRIADDYTAISDAHVAGSVPVAYDDLVSTAFHTHAAFSRVSSPHAAPGSSSGGQHYVRAGLGWSKKLGDARAPISWNRSRTLTRRNPLHIRPYAPSLGEATHPRC
jgi:hypothetical protein